MTKMRAAIRFLLAVAPGNLTAIAQFFVTTRLTRFRRLFAPGTGCGAGRSWRTSSLSQSWAASDSAGSMRPTRAASHGPRPVPGADDTDAPYENFKPRTSHYPCSGF